MTQLTGLNLEGMSAEEKKALILSLMATSEYAEVKKDKAAVEKAEKEAAAAREAKLTEARNALMESLSGSVNSIITSNLDKMLEVGIAGLTISIGDDKAVRVAPVVKGARKAASGDGTHASGGSASPTSLRSVAGQTPAALFEKYATDAEKSFYEKIKVLSSEAFNFKRAIYYPAATSDGVELPDSHKPIKAIVEEWASEGEAGKRFQGWLEKAAEVEAERSAK